MKIIPRLARITLIDVPLVFLFSVLLILCSLRFVHDECLTLLRDAVNFRRSDRKVYEKTYYDRICTEEDVSTTNVEDLFVKPDWTDKEATDNVLKHGVSVFPNLVSPETAAEARTHILERNERTPMSKQHIIIKHKNRWSYSGSPNEHPSVARALKEVATHPIFRPTIENIMGRNPALLEIQVMTAAYMAQGQHYHQDTVITGNALLQGRSFLPHYTAFIPLQDTTYKMGPTDVCPGTQYCYELDEDICEEHGFPVSGKPMNSTHKPVWKSGYGALANQQVYHRGSQHWGFGEPNRVVMILTFVPRPAARGETRLPSLGTLWALPWHGWGHTMNDMADAENGAMSQPWAAMRSLGLYKPKSREWGWDWITVNTIRIANDDNGYEREDLVDYFLVDGWGFINWTHVPRSIFGDVPEEGNAWEEFLVSTVDKWIYWTAITNVVIIAVYMSVLALFSVCIRALESIRGKENDTNKTDEYNEHNTNGVNEQKGINGTNGHNGIHSTNGPKGINGANGHNGIKNSEEKSGKENGNNVMYNTEPPNRSDHEEENIGSGIVKRAFTRIIVTYVATLLLFASVVHNVWMSGWASDLRSGLLFSPPFDRQQEILEDAVLFDEYIETSARPRRSDVLIGGTVVPPGYDTHFLNYHTGNVAWRELIKAAMPSYAIKHVNVQQVGLFPSSWSSAAFNSAIVDSIILELVSVENSRFLAQDDIGRWTVMSTDEARHSTAAALTREANEMIRYLDDKLLSLIADVRYGHLRATDLARSHSLSYLQDWRKRIFTASGSRLVDSPQWGGRISKDIQFSLAAVTSSRDNRSPNASSQRQIKIELASHQAGLLLPIGKPLRGNGQCHSDTGVAKPKISSGGTFEKGETVEIWEGGDSTRWVLGEIIDVHSDGTYNTEAFASGYMEKFVPPTDIRKLDAQNMILESIPVCSP